MAFGLSQAFQPESSTALKTKNNLLTVVRMDSKLVLDAMTFSVHKS